MKKRVGKIAFWAGIPFAILLGVLNNYNILSLAWGAGILAIAGLVIALLNVKKKEVKGMLTASIALLVLAFFPSNLTAIPLIGGLLVTILNHIGFVVAPIVLILAVKELYKTSQI